jgi:predicted helicase
MTFDKVLDKYRRMSFSERDKGNRFERLMQAYLQTDPKYANLFKKVWLWNEFFGRKDLGGTDTGIDLVALTYQGDFWAIQCKCFQEESSIDKPAVDSFLSTSSREFKDDNLKTTNFAHRLWISTTNKWGSNATEAIQNQNPPVTRLNLYDLQQAPVEWEKLDKGITGEQSRTAKKIIKPHQKEALEKAHEYFKNADRGKLIMACGTGKTFNTLRIAENETKGKGLILFLVPSISLLGQALREWSADAEEPINAICICSDPEVSKKKTKGEDTDSFSVVDLALPASTNVRDIVYQFKCLDTKRTSGMTVVFSTYQSIEVIAKAQKEIAKVNKKFGEFDLIICDEAHRTTGVALTEEDSSAFMKVHDNGFIKGKKRLYMTATPRLYSDDAKGKAAQADAVLCSMDDVSLYGEEIYRIGFGEAVEKDLLTDYKVLILTLSDKDVPPAVQAMVSDKNNEINADDASKLIGCVNALSKQILGDDGTIKATDPEPMRRAVAFCQKITVSKKITSTFNTATDAYISALPSDKKDQMVSIASKHIDGTMSAPDRDELLGWLKSSGEGNECRVLTNVRCLSEGVDVPSLDAVMFLSARNSQVDVVQSVGRVMRKAPGKKYGYIIIPVVVPAEVEAHEALDDNERYKVVWTVLNALRAHDDRFNATVNKLELNKKKPEQILVGRPEYTFENGKPVSTVGEESETKYGEVSQQLALQFEQLQGVVFARMVQKVGSRGYWEQWAKSVAEIAERQVERITLLIKEGGKHKTAFEDFLAGLQKNINPSITQQEAVEMLSQHVITKPVFEALFDRYSFVKNNPISVSMQKMLDLLEAQAIEKDTETLNKFYESVKMRASGIDNAEGKQRVIIELYDKFFKTAFPKMVEKLGIVYTPIELVDFIIHSVNYVLEKEFGRTLTDENVQLLDPFTGTGTFITRLLQSGLIAKKDMLRKYQHEIHANEIVLLAYYIAAVNIENAFHDAVGAKDYLAFDGICLTDTFQLGETDESSSFISKMFPQNSERVVRQKKAPLRVIMGNPPYSANQENAGDDNQNLSYSILDDRINDTYIASSSKSVGKSKAYDSYKRAMRWASDRLKSDGIICFVSNGSFIDDNSMDGFRKCLETEFSSIYVLNLRGNARTQGELRRKEAGNVFGGGSRTPIAITLLVKKLKQKEQLAAISYYDIVDYLSQSEKLSIVNKYHSINNPSISWKKLLPNEHGDWIKQRNEVFYSFLPLALDKKATDGQFFYTYSMGVKTNRDSWVINFSASNLIKNVKSMINFYNSEVLRYCKNLSNQKIDIEKFIDTNPAKIKWTEDLIKSVKQNKSHSFDKTATRIVHRRPFCKENLYYSKSFNWTHHLMPSLFPRPDSENLAIYITGTGTTSQFSTLMTNTLPDFQLIANGQCFPLYYFEERTKQSPSLFDTEDESEHIRRDALTDFIFDRAKKQYGKNVSKEDIFYYVYGLLHSPNYRFSFSNDLNKMLPRIPLVEEPRDFWKFSKAGRELAELHVNYESVAAYEGIKVTGTKSGFFEVEQLRFPKKEQKDTIIYNSKIMIENIPLKAYEYVVNGRSAIEWIMERYQVSTHKESGITNNPNDWAKEVGNPRYILDLLLSIINVSMKTVKIVEGLPKIDFN